VWHPSLSWDIQNQWVWWLQIKQLTQACIEKSKDKTQLTLFYHAFRLSCISGFRHPSFGIKVLTPWVTRKWKGLYIHSSFMSWHNDMHLAQTTITYVVLNPKKIFWIEAFFIRMNGYRILPLQKHKRINIHSCFLLQVTKSLSIKFF